VNETILKVEEIHTFIGKHHILQGVSLEARADAATILIGRNGAGKSTTLRTVMGLLPPSQGKIFYNGIEIHKKKPFEIARIGISFVPEDREIFENLTVEENMKVAILNEKAIKSQRIEWIYGLFPDIKRFWKAKAATLSGGQKQMLAIARGIVNNPALLLIDEPVKGLAPIIVKALIDVIKQIKEHSVVILVEQNLYMAISVGDYFYIMDSGFVVRSGLIEELACDEGLKSRYLGISNKEETYLMKKEGSFK